MSSLRFHRCFALSKERILESEARNSLKGFWKDLFRSLMPKKVCSLSWAFGRSTASSVRSSFQLHVRGCLRRITHRTTTSFPLMLPTLMWRGSYAWMRSPKRFLWFFCLQNCDSRPCDGTSSQWYLIHPRAGFNSPIKHTGHNISTLSACQDAAVATVGNAGLLFFWVI
jgi:hypothetical protein